MSREMIKLALTTPREMDSYLELSGAQEIIDDIKLLASDYDCPPKVSPTGSDAALQRLIDACRGVPYLATSINETLAKAGLRLEIIEATP